MPAKSSAHLVAGLAVLGEAERGGGGLEVALVARQSSVTRCVPRIDGGISWPWR